MTDKEITVDLFLELSEPMQTLKALSFEKSLKLLEDLVAAVERGSLPLERSIQSYEKGALLVEHLRSVLNQAEARLAVIKKDRSDKIVEEKI